MRREKVLLNVRKLSAITMEVWKIMLMIVLVSKMPKKYMHVTWSDIDSKESASIASKDAKYDPNDLLAFIASMEYT